MDISTQRALKVITEATEHCQEWGDQLAHDWHERVAICEVEGIATQDARRIATEQITETWRSHCESNSLTRPA